MLWITWGAFYTYMFPESTPHPEWIRIPRGLINPWSQRMLVPDETDVPTNRMLDVLANICLSVYDDGIGHDWVTCPSFSSMTACGSNHISVYVCWFGDFWERPQPTPLPSGGNYIVTVYIPPRFLCFPFLSWISISHPPRNFSASKLSNRGNRPSAKPVDSDIQQRTGPISMAPTEVACRGSPET